MITKKQLEILKVFCKNLFREYTFKEVKEISKEKSNSVIQNAIKVFLKEELINERQIGTSKLFSINHENSKIYSYFEIIANEEIGKLVKKSIKIVGEEINKKTSFYSLVIFGSYSVNENKKDSDLDVAVFIESEDKRKLIEACLNSAKLKSILKIDGHVIVKNEFLEMLKADYANLGKEIAKKHLAVYNSLIFYNILKEGIKNGFRL